MIIRREWTVGCACPDCGEPMPPLVRIQDQHYPQEQNSPDGPSLPDVTYLSPSLIMGAKPYHCDRCGVTHDASRLEPVLARVDLGPREV